MTREISADQLTRASLVDIACTLETGGVVCLPTDTVYGLAVNPANPVAVERLFALKGRDEAKPILLLLNSIEMARMVSLPNPVFEEVAAAFWPGPLTLITGAQDHLLNGVTAGTGTIGVRWPKAAIAQQIIGAFGSPITGTSANRSGQAEVRSAIDARQQLGDGIDVTINGGELEDSQASTVLDLSGDQPVLLREGPISYQSLVRFFDGRLQRRTA
jgi:L-threonylcarbamoyladenylate synthase